MKKTLLVLLPLLAACAGEPAKDTRPNILFILTDDHRADAMGCYGNASIRTPNFDRFASEGVRLDNFYVSCPICCPSRASFLTGLYPHQNGVEHNVPPGAKEGKGGKGGPDLREGERTVAHAMKEAGYLTGFVGKAHLGGDPRKWGFEECPLWLPQGAAPHAGSKLMQDGKPVRPEGHITENFADAAVAWLEKHKGDRFFLWLATTAPHTPYLELPEYAYDAAKIQPPPMWPKGEPLGQADWKGYYATISMLDAQIGRVLDKVKELGLEENTFVFIAGDNGFMHHSHGHKAKAVWFEEASRVPALARWPGHVKPGSSTAAPMESADLMATLCEVAGTKPAPGRVESSMLPALTGGKPVRETAYVEQGPCDASHWQQVGPWAFVREGKWKYVWREKEPAELYDLEADPNELKSLAADPACKATLEALEAKRQAWLKATPRP